jgi:hypothetical protein
VTDDAREAWRRKHRRQRIRAPKVELARNIAAVVVFVLTLGFIALGVFVAWGWGTGAFVCGYLFLRLRGIRPFEGDPPDGADAYTG